MKTAFRFCFVYLTLYAMATQISGGLLLFPNFSFPGLGPLWPFREITFWVAEHLLGIEERLVYAGNSGDTTFYWVQTFWLLAVSLVATLLWSVLDRRTNDATLRKWFQLFLRFALAAQMFEYGMAKVIPTQFPAPSLATLVEPVGNLTLTGILWTSMGARVNGSRGWRRS